MFGKTNNPSGINQFTKGGKRAAAFGRRMADKAKAAGTKAATETPFKMKGTSMVAKGNLHKVARGAPKNAKIAAGLAAVAASTMIAKKAQEKLSKPETLTSKIKKAVKSAGK